LALGWKTSGLFQILSFELRYALRRGMACGKIPTPPAGSDRFAIRLQTVGS
jgi:hypothetical protein